VERPRAPDRRGGLRRPRVRDLGDEARRDRADEPAEYDYELILSVFSQSFLQPVFQQATDVWEMMLRWNRARRRFEPGRVRRRTDSGANACVIPEFAWDPGGRRLLWTQNKSGDGYRIDQSRVANELRSAIVARLSGVDSIVQIPFDIVPQIRAAAGGFLRDPATYPYDGACGAVGRPSSYAQETRIGRFAE
jgi:hypothetical protein